MVITEWTNELMNQWINEWFYVLYNQLSNIDIQRTQEDSKKKVWIKNNWIGDRYVEF